MKIFNWVHRKFNHNALKDEFGIRDWKNKEVVVDHGSILSIGTFGFDPSCIYQQHNDQVDHDCPITTSYKKITEIQEPAHHHHHHHHQVAHVIDQEEEEEDDDESEVKPLMFTKFKEYEFGMTSPNNDNNNNVNATSSGCELIMNVDGISLLPEITTSVSVDDDGKKKGEMRTTLADLFWADSHAQINNNKADSNTNNTVSSAKKLIPQVGDKSQLVKKLNQMMKRVMKRKIHPAELHNIVQAATPPKNMDALELQTIDDSAYLLPIPGVIV